MKTIAKLNQQDRNEQVDTVMQAVADYDEAMLLVATLKEHRDTQLVENSELRNAIVDSHNERQALQQSNAELLAALETLVFVCDFEHHPDGRVGLGAVMVARSAIARAKGQGKV